MTDTLTQLISKLQALLIDDGTTFSTATCTAAIRQALKVINQTVPQHAADTVDAVPEQYEYELSNSLALAIVDVLRQGTDTYKDYNLGLAFDGYFEDDRPFFRLRTPEAAGTTLIVRYTLGYTINGLDSSSDSNLPALYDVVLLDGAAAQACLVRAAGRVETVNQNPDVGKKYLDLADHFRLAFELGLAHLGRRKFTRSEPDRHAWNDEWAGKY